MTEGDISTAVSMWREQAAAELPWDEIERALRRLPDAGVCAVSDDAGALFMLAPTDTLFTVSVDGREVMVSSRPLDAARLTVNLRWSGHATQWRFSYTGEAQERERWQEMSGSVAMSGGLEQLDDREQFARAVAERAGWTRGAREPAGAERPAASAPEEPAQDEPRWRARTDVWGRPLDVRRH